MASGAAVRATYDDLLTAPADKVAELINGRLELSPRPAKAHAAAASALGGELYSPFHRGRGGPGGWITLDEPQVHFAEDVLVPDIAGWRRARMPYLTTEEAYFTLAPDWICEVLSPRTERMDRSETLAIYGKGGVAYAWLVNPLQRTLEVFRCENQRWLMLGVHSGSDRVRAEPFEALDLDLSALWADVASQG